MKLKPKKLIIDEANPFAEDALGRQQYATVLTNILQNTDGGFSLAITADWGYGKTTFVEKWRCLLKKAGYTTIYFNAWETDFAEDPFLAIIDGIVDQVPLEATKGEKKHVAKAVADAALEMLKVVPYIGEIATVVGTMKKGIEEVHKGETKIEDYRSSTRTIKEFREKLENYAEVAGNGKQLVIFVDELDRCRPDYAIEMLERIKHFFSIDNIIFVLSIDKKVMLGEIRGFYNNEEIDAEAYLRRFIDLEFALPEPAIKDFVGALCDYHGIGDYIQQHTSGGGYKYEYSLKNTVATCFSHTEHSLRDVEKYFNRLDIVIRSLPPKSCESGLLALLLYLHIFRKDVSGKISRIEYGLAELTSDLEQIFGARIIDDSDSNQQSLTMVYEVLNYYDYKFREANDNNREYVESETQKLKSFKLKTIRCSNWEQIVASIQNNFPTNPPQRIAPYIEMANVLFRWNDEDVPREILDAIRKNNKISLDEVCIQCKLTNDVAITSLNYLINQRIIRSEVSGEAGPWIIDEKRAANLI